MKDLRVTKIVNEIKFDGVWDELEGKNCFHRKSFTKYLRQTLVFMLNSEIQNSFNFYISGVFCYFQQNFYSGRKTGH